MSARILLIASMILLITGIFSCSPRSKYEFRLKKELAGGERNDSLFFGLYLGMTDKDFYNHCWNLNKKGLVRQGANNTTVQYIMENELKHRASMDFYPFFTDGKISAMPVQYAYLGWAPWNRELSSDKLLEDVLNYYKQKYGRKFLEVRHKEKGSAYINLKGNRRISIFKKDDISVWAVFSDMQVWKDMPLFQTDSTKIRK